jgi:hypothetical protein
MGRKVAPLTSHGQAEATSGPITDRGTRVPGPGIIREPWEIRRASRWTLSAGSRPPPATFRRVSGAWASQGSLRATSDVVVGLARIELATSALSVLRSNRLSYSPRCVMAPEGRSRLHHGPPHPANLVLHLIHWPTCGSPAPRVRRPRARRCRGGCRPRRTIADSARPAWPSQPPRRGGTGRRRWR